VLARLQRLRINSLAVVPHYQAQFPSQVFNFNFHTPGFRVPQSIQQRLSRN
jgi:hypothetical protein